MTANAKPNASDRRFDAIRAVTDELIPGGILAPEVTRESAATLIATLAPLGRTERWQTAIKNWQAIVRDEEYDLRWAIVQYAIFAGFQA